MVMFPLKRGTIRAYAQEYIRASVERGLISAETIRLLGDEGLTYRRTTMLADYRDWANVTKKASALKFVRKDYQIGADLYSPVKYSQVLPYRYEVKVTFYDPRREKRIIEFTNIESYDPLTPGRAESEAGDIYRPVVTDYELGELTTTIHAGFKK